MKPQHILSHSTHTQTTSIRKSYELHEVTDPRSTTAHRHRSQITQHHKQSFAPTQYYYYWNVLTRKLTCKLCRVWSTNSTTSLPYCDYPRDLSWAANVWMDSVADVVLLIRWSDSISTNGETQKYGNLAFNVNYRINVNYNSLKKEWLLV